MDSSISKHMLDRVGRAVLLQGPILVVMVSRFGPMQGRMR
jgi:hypothetical protein